MAGYGFSGKGWGRVGGSGKKPLTIKGYTIGAHLKFAAKNIKSHLQGEGRYKTSQYLKPRKGANKKGFVSKVKNLFSKDNVSNKYASINYLNRESKKVKNKKNTPVESVTALNQGTNIFQPDATALQSDAKSRQIYGGTAAQRATASNVAATNDTDALFASGGRQTKNTSKSTKSTSSKKSNQGATVSLGALGTSVTYYKRGGKMKKGGGFNQYD